MKMTESHQGFSLIELLIVVAIIGIIAAIAIPNLLASKRAANEASAIGSLRTVTGAQTAYQLTKGAGRYGDLTKLMNEGLVDGVLGAGTKSGYAYTAANLDADATHPDRFNLNSVPQQPTGIGATGTRSFYTNESGVIYFVLGGTAPTADATTRAVSGGAALK